jgi:hypothetical protein
LDHVVGSYDGAFFALAFFRQTRQEGFRAWDAGAYEVAWQLLDVQCRFWWSEFLRRRERVRRELSR